MKIKYFVALVFVILVSLSAKVSGQSGVIVNMASIDGVDITPDNILKYQVQSPISAPSVIKGVLRFHNSTLSISYSFNYNLKQGLNLINNDVNPQWQFSSSALRDLFTIYKRLPAGTYEYCITVTENSKGANDAMQGGPAEECVYHKSDDLFLINLVDPEDDAKIHEYNPPLSWVVNYPFANELTYRLRVAEIQKNQNAQIAITRNNPIYDEYNIYGNSIIYPVTAKPLIKDQLYAWTVDAYYHGLLLGGAEMWKFTIVDDSIFVPKQVPQAYYEFAKHSGDTRLNIFGELKLKYNSDYPNDTLNIHLYDDKKNEIYLPANKVPLIPGDNRFSIVFDDQLNLGDQKKYFVTIINKEQQTYQVPFTYINPLYVK